MINIQIKQNVGSTLIRINEKLNITADEIQLYVKMHDFNSIVTRRNKQGKECVKAQVQHVLIKKGLNIFRLDRRLGNKQVEMLYKYLYNLAGLVFDGQKAAKKTNMIRNDNDDSIKTINIPKTFTGFTGCLATGINLEFIHSPRELSTTKHFD